METTCTVLSNTGQKAVPCLSEHLDFGAKSKQLSGEKDVKKSQYWLPGFTWGWVAEQEGEGWCLVLKVTPLWLEVIELFGKSGVTNTTMFLCAKSSSRRQEGNISQDELQEQKEKSDDSSCSCERSV